jgi:hypothetical protein
VQALAAALSVVATSEAGLLPAASSQLIQAALGKDELQAGFNDLLSAIADNNPEALDIVQRLLDGVGEGNPGYEQLHGAHEALDMFDFGSAQERLQEAAEAVGLA